MQKGAVMLTCSPAAAQTCVVTTTVLGPSIPDDPARDEPGGGNGGASTETAPAIEEESATDEETAPGEGWAVILYDDDVHDMIEVTAAIHIATGFEPEQCWEIMMRAHSQGKAVVTITEKQEAEKIVSVLRTFKLTAELRRM